MAFEIVVVGASAGGLHALQALLSDIGEGFPLPVVIVQHRGTDVDSGLCEFLARRSKLPLSEPEDKELIASGHAYLAPRDYHLLIEERTFALSTDAPVAYARPSIDLLFESAADEYRERTIGVILTGANSDGARGLARIKSFAGLAIVEDPHTAKAPIMPRAAIAATRVDWIVPRENIGTLLQQLSNSRGKQHVE